MSKLYEIDNHLNELAEMVESKQLSPEEIMDTLDALGMERKEKAKNIGFMLMNLEAQAGAIDNEVARLNNRKKAIGNRAVWLKDYLLSSMLKNKEKKIETDLFTFTYRKPSEVAVVDDEEKLSDSFFIEVPASSKLDKKALLAALKQGDVEGAHLEDSKINLQIK